MKKIALVMLVSCLLFITGCQKQAKKTSLKKQQPNVEVSRQSQKQEVKGFVDNTFTSTDNLKWHITNVSTADGINTGRKVIVFEVDITNVGKQAQKLIGQPYSYLQASQNEGNNKVTLDPSLASLGANGQSQYATREQNMTGTVIAPNQTVQGIFIYELQNNNAVNLVLLDQNSQKIAEQKYSL